nr:hypothetical protein [Candidatus Freyarchaeota archaeon]
MIILLLFAAGSVVTAIGYWYILANSASLLFNGILNIASGLLLVPLFSGDWAFVFGFIAQMFLGRYVDFQLAIGMFSAQVIFYLVLSVVLFFVAWGLFRMRNWARVITIIYCILILVSFFIFFLAFPSKSGFSYYPFNINIPMVLFSLTSLLTEASNYIPFPFLISSIELAISIIMAIAIPLYLFGDVKYEFR